MATTLTPGADCAARYLFQCRERRSLEAIQIHVRLLLPHVGHLEPRQVHDATLASCIAAISTGPTSCSSPCPSPARSRPPSASRRPSSSTPRHRHRVGNFMHGIGLDADIRSWFDLRVPKTAVPRHFIERALARR